MARLPVAGPVVIPNAEEIKLHWAFAGRLFSNVLHGNLTTAGPLNPALAETIFAALKTQTSTTAWLAECSTNLSFTGVSIKDLRAANNPELLSTGPAALGTGVTNAMPLNASLVITLRTAQSGPGFRGRVYLAGMLATGVTDGLHFTQAFSDAAVAFVQGIQSVATAQQTPLVVAQRALAAGTHADGSPFAARSASVVPVIAVVQENLRVDSQRRRTGR